VRGRNKTSQEKFSKYDVSGKRAEKARCHILRCNEARWIEPSEPAIRQTDALNCLIYWNEKCFE
jgi:hypothetical protein